MQTGENIAGYRILSALGAGGMVEVWRAKDSRLGREVAHKVLPAEIAEALESAHEAGIVHRDLKPAKITLEDDGTVKVLDCGLAKAWEAKSADHSLSLSPTLTRQADTLLNLVVNWPAQVEASR